MMDKYLLFFLIFTICANAQDTILQVYFWQKYYNEEFWKTLSTPTLMKFLGPHNPSPAKQIGWSQCENCRYLSKQSHIGTHVDQPSKSLKAEKLSRRKIAVLICAGILKIPKAKKTTQKVLSAYYKLDKCQLLQICRWFN